MILIISLIAAAGVSQACTQVVAPDLGGGDSGAGGGIIVPSGPLSADVKIVSHPQGGQYVSELACAFEVTEIPGTGSSPIILTVNWVAPCGTHGSDVFVFDGGQEVFESSYSEGGRSIAMTFWATISWTDAQGSHQLQSNFAACQ